jgi:osmotically-inducible protein OsmY
MRIAAALALIVALAAPAAAETPDPWITTKVKLALVTNETLGGVRIDVDTVEGKVTLHGKVSRKEESQHAEAIARSVTGVREVRNLLQLVPPSQHERTQAADDWIQREISARLGRIAGGRMSVASVNAGVVLLAGNARSSAELLSAIERVRRVRGVRRVASEVRIAADDAGLDVWNGHELRQSSGGFIDAASDIWITAEVRLALYAEDDIPTGDISVDTRNGIVTLFGSVPTADQKEEAEDEAEDVRGVRRVRNLLQVVPAKAQAEVERTDAELEARVRDTLYGRQEMKGLGIRVAIRKRFVRLTGTVPSQQHRVLAAAVARHVPGVRAVDADDLEVARVTTAAEAPPATPRKR